MKAILLTALTLLLAGNCCPVQADERASAGAATPVQLDSGDRARAEAAKAAAAKNKAEEAKKATSTAESQIPAIIRRNPLDKRPTFFPKKPLVPGRQPAAANPAATGTEPATEAQPVTETPEKQKTFVPGQKGGFAAPGVTITVGSQPGVTVLEKKKPGVKEAAVKEPAAQKTAFTGKGLIPPPPKLLNPPPPPAAITPSKKAKSAKPEVPVDKTTVVGNGGPFTLAGKPKEEFATSFNWQPDEITDTLTFKAKFSGISQPKDRSPHFNWLRIMLGNQIIADERALRGKTDCSLDLTGKVDKGINQITVSAQGSPGATFEWKLRTPKKCILSAVDPDEVLVGKDVALKGQNFETNPIKDVVSLSTDIQEAGRGAATIISKTLTPSSASTAQLKLRIPKDFTPGDYLVKVTIEGMSSHTQKLCIRGIPELTGTNLNGVPPGATLVIFGKNFSKKVGDNKVTFDTAQAQVTSSTTEQLTVLVPNFENPAVGDTYHLSGQVGIPIRVKVGKFDAINTVPISIGNSMWQDPGMRGGPDTPQVPVDWRRLLEN